MHENTRKQRIQAFFDQLAPDRDDWIKRNQAFYSADWNYMRFLVPEGLKVLEIGCGTGQLLAALKPSLGVGVDISEEMVEIARESHPGLEFVVCDAETPANIKKLGGPFDVIVLSDTIGLLDDIEATLASLQSLCAPETRIIVAYYSRLWEPALRLAEKIGGKMPQVEQNWLSPKDIALLLDLADFETVHQEWKQLLPKHLLGIGPVVNKYVGTLPGIRNLCLRNYVVARPKPKSARKKPSVSVVIPCRNERGNVEAAIKRMPKFSPDMEIVFVEGHSADGTFEEIERVIAAYPDWDIKAFRQEGKGKGDAMKKGFGEATKDVLMILDADLTVPPETLPKFYNAIARGKGEFINGSRLIYPMEDGAMRFLNLIANRLFSYLFSWLLSQRLTDTLCGTKVLRREDYRKIDANRDYFGDFDPFGDYDLIFGASKLNLKIAEVPIRYAAREYGEPQISRFRDGMILFKMVAFAYRKLKAI